MPKHLEIFSRSPSIRKYQQLFCKISSVLREHQSTRLDLDSVDMELVLTWNLRWIPSDHGPFRYQQTTLSIWCFTFIPSPCWISSTKSQHFSVPLTQSDVILVLHGDCDSPRRKRAFEVFSWFDAGSKIYIMIAHRKVVDNAVLKMLQVSQTYTVV